MCERLRVPSRLPWCANAVCVVGMSMCIQAGRQVSMRQSVHLSCTVSPSIYLSARRCIRPTVLSTVLCCLPFDLSVPLNYPSTGLVVCMGVHVLSGRRRSTLSSCRLYSRNAGARPSFRRMPSESLPRFSYGLG